MCRADGLDRPDAPALSRSARRRLDQSRWQSAGRDAGDAFHGNGFVSKLEILRGDLVDVLYQATKDQTDYRFNTRIEDLNQSADAVQTTLSDGTTVSAELVVGCDGPHSALRRLAFGPEEQFVKPLGGYNAWFTAPTPSASTVGI